MGRLHEYHLLKALKGKCICISCCHLGQEVTVEARNRQKSLGRKKLEKELFGGIRAMKSSVIFQRIQKLKHMHSAERMLREDLKFSHLADLLGLSKKKVKANAELQTSRLMKKSPN